MEANRILRSAQGYFAGGLFRLRDIESRLTSLQAVADDIASGVAPLLGLETHDAEALAHALSHELAALASLREQLTSGYARLLALSSRLPPG